MSVVHGRRVSCECGERVDIPDGGDAVRLRCARCGAGFDILTRPDTAGAGPLRTHDAVEIARTPPPPPAFVDRSGGTSIRRLRLRIQTFGDWWRALVDPAVLAALIGGGAILRSWWFIGIGLIHAWYYAKRLEAQGGAVRWFTIADGCLSYRRWYVIFPARTRVPLAEIEEIYAYEGRVYLRIRGQRTISIGGSHPLDPVSLGWLIDHIRTGIDAARGEAARAIARVAAK